MERDVEKPLLDGDTLNHRNAQGIPEIRAEFKNVAKKLSIQSHEDLEVREAQEAPGVHLCHKIWKSTRDIESLLLIAYLLFPIFEQPLWCYYTSCGAETQYIQSNMPKMSPVTSQLVELGFLLLFSASILLRVVFSGYQKCIKQKWPVIEAAIILATAICLVIMAIGNHYHNNWLVWSPFLRPIFFVVKNRETRSVFSAIVKSLTGVLPILGILALQIFLFGWIGVLIFLDEEPVKEYVIHFDTGNKTP